MAPMGWSRGGHSAENRLVFAPEPISKARRVPARARAAQSRAPEENRRHRRSVPGATSWNRIIGPSNSGSMRVSKRAGVRRVRKSVYYTTSFLVCPRRRTKFPIILRLDYKVATLPSASLLPNTHRALLGLIATSLVLPRVAGFH